MLTQQLRLEENKRAVWYILRMYVCMYVYMWACGSLARYIHICRHSLRQFPTVPCKYVTSDCIQKTPGYINLGYIFQGYQHTILPTLQSHIRTYIFASYSNKNYVPLPCVVMLEECGIGPGNAPALHSRPGTFPPAEPHCRPVAAPCSPVSPCSGPH